MKRFGIALLGLGLVLLSVGPVWAWDGRWTQATSGEDVPFDDNDTSNTKAGTDPPQKFWKPTPNEYIDVDPDELSDYYNRHRKDYAPYALARIEQPLRLDNVVIPIGYYLVKLGGAEAGSPRINMKTISQPPVQPPEGGQIIYISAESRDLPLKTGAQQAGIFTLENRESLPPLDLTDAALSQRVYSSPEAATGRPNTGISDATGAQGPTIPEGTPVYQVFVFKRLGKVVAVVPLQRMTAYKPARKEHIPKRPLAWVEEEERQPVFKLYFNHWVYSTRFQS